jgi:hypothetical protein
MTADVSGATVGIAVGVIITLWLASMGLAIKITLVLSQLSNELGQLRKATRLNTKNIANIQQRFNVPQATDDDLDDDESTGWNGNRQLTG